MKTFNFVFEDDIYSITNELLLKWDNIENKQNRLCDNIDLDSEIILLNNNTIRKEEIL